MCRRGVINQRTRNRYGQGNNKRGPETNDGKTIHYFISQFQQERRNDNSDNTGQEEERDQVKRKTNNPADKKIQ